MSNARDSVALRPPRDDCSFFAKDPVKVRLSLLNLATHDTELTQDMNPQTEARKECPQHVCALEKYYSSRRGLVVISIDS